MLSTAYTVTATIRKRRAARDAGRAASHAAAAERTIRTPVEVKNSRSSVDTIGGLTIPRRRACVAARGWRRYPSVPMGEPMAAAAVVPSAWVATPDPILERRGRLAAASGARVDRRC